MWCSTRSSSTQEAAWTIASPNHSTTHHNYLTKVPFLNASQSARLTHTFHLHEQIASLQYGAPNCKSPCWGVVDAFGPPSVATCGDNTNVRAAWGTWGAGHYCSLPHQHWHGQCRQKGRQCSSLLADGNMLCQLWADAAHAISLRVPHMQLRRSIGRGRKHCCHVLSAGVPLLCSPTKLGQGALHCCRCGV